MNPTPQQTKAWRDANKEHVRQYMKVYRATRKDEIRQQQREYFASHPERQAKKKAEDRQLYHAKYKHDSSYKERKAAITAASYRRRKSAREEEARTYKETHWRELSGSMWKPGDVETLDSALRTNLTEQAKQCKVGIYAIGCAATGKVYVGSSKNIYGRWKSHRVALSTGKHPVPELQEDWKKYGSAYFYFAVLELCTRETQRQREQHNIDLVPLALRYNLSPTAGSNKDYKHRPESTDKHSRAQRLLADEQVREAKDLYLAGETCAAIGKRYGVGLWVIHRAIRGKLKSDSGEAVVGVPRRKRTPEQRKRMSEAARPPISDETRQKISAANKGRKILWADKISAANMGKVRTDAIRRQMSESRKAWVAEHPEERVRLGALNKGKPWSPARRAAFEIKRGKQEQSCSTQ